MKKRIFSLALVFALAFSLSAPVFAATYKDITNHWAKAYLETLSDKGVLKGFSDGTMRPDQNITVGEALVILSRLYTVSDSEKALIASDYEAEVKAAAPSNYSWAYENLEICRAAEILSKDEFKAINLASELKKEDLAVYLVRAMRYTAQAEKLSAKDMSFTDASKVSAACAGSVAELAKLGILTGDEKKNVSPQSSVTRAVVGAMTCRAIEALAGSGTGTLTIEAYKGVTRAEGVITAADGISVTVTGFDGLTRNYAVSSDASVKVNGTEKALSSAYAGCHVTLTLRDGTVDGLAIDSDTTTKWYQGTLTAAAASGLVSFKNAVGTVASYPTAATVKVTLDGAAYTLANLAAGQFLTIKCVSGAVTEITAVTKVAAVRGTITGLTYGTTVVLKMQDSGGASYSFTFDFSALPAVTRGSQAISVDRLTKGVDVTVSTDGTHVSAITVNGNAGSVSGQLTAISMTTSGTIWTVTGENSTATYTLDEDANAYSGTTAIALSSIRIGDQVKLSVFGSVITDVWQLSAASSATKVTGSVLKLDTTAKQLTVLTPDNKLVYISTGSVGSIVIASTGATGSLSSIAVNAQITAYGTYVNSRSFTARSIVIE